MSWILDIRDVTDVYIATSSDTRENKGTGRMRLPWLVGNLYSICNIQPGYMVFAVKTQGSPSGTWYLGNWKTWNL